MSCRHYVTTDLMAAVCCVWNSAQRLSNSYGQCKRVVLGLVAHQCERSGSCVIILCCSLLLSWQPLSNNDLVCQY